MPAISNSSPGKSILFGEHAVVYGKPAIAVPVTQVKSHAYIVANPKGLPDDIWLEAPDIGLNAHIADIPIDDPIVKAIMLVKEHLEIQKAPSFKIKVTSTIPIAAGLGSGASISISIIRATSEFFGHPLSNEEVNQIAFEIEKIHHGNPSGIDNTVITYNSPVFFQRNYPIKPVHISQDIHLIIADTGIKSPTSIAVTKVREQFQSLPEQYQNIFDEIGGISEKAYTSMESGNIQHLGQLMNENHKLLQSLGVSCSELDALVKRACDSGAFGAKLCGAGMGGSMIALVDKEHSMSVQKILIHTGAVNSICTTIKAR